MTDEVDQTKTIIDSEEESKPVNEADPPEKETPVDPTITMLSEIKREDGSQKYSDVASALKALKESQSFIKTLETDNQGLKDKLELYKEKAERTIAMEELLESMKASGNEPEKPSKSSDPADIENLVASVIDKREATRNIRQNQKIVADKLIAKFGDKDKATEFYKNKASELDIGLNFLNDLAGHSPEAASKLLGLEDKNVVVGTEDVKSTTKGVWRPVDPNQKPTSIMAGATSEQLKAAWNRARPTETN